MCAVGHVVDDVVSARQREGAGGDGAAVVELFGHGRGQGEPRRAVGDAGRPQGDDDPASATHRVGRLRSHRVTDGDVPAPTTDRTHRRHRSLPRKLKLARTHFYTIHAVLFCLSAVLDPSVGHTMDVLSPFIPVLRHSD